MRFWTILFTVCVILAGFAQAQVIRSTLSVSSVDTRVLFVGADPFWGAPNDLPKEISTYSIPSLPQENAARDNAVATFLRATPVSTLVSDPSAQKPRPDQFFMVSNLTLFSDSESVKLAIGDDDFPLDELTGRMAATIDAFNPSHRAVAFMSFDDQEDRFPKIVSSLQATLTQSGFDMIVAVVANGEEAVKCLPNSKVAIHYSIIGGVPDKGQFGNGDGVSDAGEVGQYLGRVLALQAENRRDCGPGYSLILKSEEKPDAVIAVHNELSGFRDLEAMLYHENFESKFLLKSEEEQKIADYLTECTYCPNQSLIVERLSNMRAVEQTRLLEEQVWLSISEDDTPTRLSIYLDECSSCEYSNAATEKIHILNLQAQAREAEAKLFSQARDALHLSVLKKFAADCVACDYRDDALNLIAKIETDVVHKAESIQLQDAIKRSDAKAVLNYLNTCKVCAARTEAQSAMEHLSRLAEVSTRCIRLAGMPQEGGPRLLTEIDVIAAREACTSALKKFPGETGLVVRLGRIAQSEGDGSAAMEAYEYGTRSGLPMAFGLAAYIRYNGFDGKPVDFEVAADLARKGAVEGDWLSRELLSLIYSKNLVRDYNATEGFKIALELAEEGNIVAQFFAGYFYLTGTGVDVSDLDAEHWLGMATEGGYHHAMAHLAGLYEDDNSEVASPERAAEIYLAGLKASEPTVKDRLTKEIRERSDAVIQVIQAHLKEEGVYKGKLDGKAGKGTLTAIEKYIEINSS